MGGGGGGWIISGITHPTIALANLARKVANTKKKKNHSH